MYTDFVIHVGMPEIFLLDARIPHPHASEFLHTSKCGKDLTHMLTNSHWTGTHSQYTEVKKNRKNKGGSIFMRHWSC